MEQNALNKNTITIESRLKIIKKNTNCKNQHLTKSAAESQSTDQPKQQNNKNKDEKSKKETC